MTTDVSKLSRNEAVYATCSVKINGSDLPSSLFQNIMEVRVEQSLNLPSMVEIEFMDYELSILENTLLKIGNPIKILMGYENTRTEVFNGEITGRDLNMIGGGSPVVVVRGYDKLHRLHQGRKTRTFIQASDSDILQKIATGVSLSGTGGATSVYPHIVQNNETDYEFLIRRARKSGMELVIEDTKLIFKERGTEKTVKVDRLESLLEFSMHHSTASTTKEVTVRGWDPQTKTAIVGKSKNSDAIPTLTIGEDKIKSKPTYGGKSKMFDISRPVVNQTEAQNIAKAIHDEMTADLVVAEGLIYGNPKVKPGKLIEVSLSKFNSKGGTDGTSVYSGKYYMTACTHLYKGNSYTTRFQASGKEPETFMDLTGQGDRTERIFGVLPGLVSNVKDEKDQGRIKVVLPTMVDSITGNPIETDWIRMTTLLAGKQFGFFFLPEVNDEVLVAFENGDVNFPYVIGFLFNGKDHPPKKNSAVEKGGKINERLLKTRSGHIISLDDSDDNPKISITDKTTKNKFIIDSSKNSINIECDSGDFNIKSSSGDVKITSGTKNIVLTASTGKITLSAKDVEINGVTSAKMHGGQVEVKSDTTAKFEGLQVSVKASAAGEFDGGGVATIKGGLVKIN